MDSYADVRIKEYRAARDALLAAAPELSTSPARYLIQLGQPSASVAARDSLMITLASQSAAIEQFKCTSTVVLNYGLRALACSGIPSSSAKSPLPDRIHRMFGDTLIGPNGWSLMDSMIAVSRTATLTWTDGTEQYRFLAPEDLDPEAPPTPHLQAAARERHGRDLLQAMSPMAELNILQQSVAYGDLVPQLVLDILYDSNTRLLRLQIDPNATPDIRFKQGAALNAMQLNPILGRNVVMLAVRKALIAANGVFPTTYYGLAIDHFRGTQACTKNAVAMRKLRDLFPGWKFEYRVERAPRDGGDLAACKPEDDKVARGTGLTLDFGTFYVRMPSAEVASEGVFEYPQSLAIALHYREKIGQELIDRNISSYFLNDRMKTDFIDAVGNKFN